MYTVHILSTYPASQPYLHDATTTNQSNIMMNDEMMNVPKPHIHPANVDIAASTAIKWQLPGAFGSS